MNLRDRPPDMMVWFESPALSVPGQAAGKLAAPAAPIIWPGLPAAPIIWPGAPAAPIPVPPVWPPPALLPEFGVPFKPPLATLVGIVPSLPPGVGLPEGLAGLAAAGLGAGGVATGISGELFP